MDIPPHRKIVSQYHRTRTGFNLSKHVSFIVVLILAMNCIGNSTRPLYETIPAFIDPDATFECRKSLNSNQSVKRLFHETSTISAKKSSVRLYMSSLGREPKDKEAKQNLGSWITSKLPPAPEDQLTLSGDVAFIFFYSFINHMVSGMYDSAINSPEITSARSALAAIESSSAASAGITGYDSSLASLPVWFDPLNSAPFGIVPLSAALPIEKHIMYAPALGTAGLSAVLFTSSWLLCGYFTGAFQFKNTLQCSTRHAINNAAKTVLFTSIVMVSLALESDYFVGCHCALHKSVGLTKADITFIFDTLSMLVLWRFMTSSILGYGGGSDD